MCARRIHALGRIASSSTVPHWQGRGRADRRRYRETEQEERKNRMTTTQRSEINRLLGKESEGTMWQKSRLKRSVSPPQLRYPIERICVCFVWLSSLLCSSSILEIRVRLDNCVYQNLCTCGRVYLWDSRLWSSNRKDKNWDNPISDVITFTFIWICANMPIPWPIVTNTTKSVFFSIILVKLNLLEWKNKCLPLHLIGEGCTWLWNHQHF